MTTEENLIREYEQVLLCNIPQMNTVYFASAHPEVARRNALRLLKYLIEDILKLNKDTALSTLNENLLRQFRINAYINRYVQQTSLVPVEERIEFLINSVYNPNSPQVTSSKYIIETYQKILNGEVTVPKTFFKDSQGRINASICLQTAIETYMMTYKWASVDEAYEFFADSPRANKFLKMVKLDCACKTHYGSDALMFFHYSLSLTESSPFLYNFYKFQKNYEKTQKTMKKEIKDAKNSNSN